MDDSARNRKAQELPECTIIRGLDAVTGALEEVAAAADGFGQSGVIAGVTHFLSMPSILRKQPLLLMFRAPDGTLRGAVLVFALAGPLSSLALYSTYNWRGQRNVFGKAADRPALAAAAARALISRGAHLASIDFEVGGPDEIAGDEARVMASLEAEFADWRDAAVKWSVRPESRQFDLLLGTTYQETLSQIHTRSRANLRYYRRNAERDLGCRFVAAVAIDELEFLRMNAQSKYRVSQRLAKWRYRPAADVSAFFCGLRAGDGRWLSMAGGRRSEGVAEIDWLMNREDLPRYSLGTVMRSCLIEHEVALGTRSLMVEGGTSHPLSGSFRYGNVYNVSLKRASLRIKLAERAASLSPTRLILQHLHEPDRVWR